jgi:hypothetical protein
LRAGRRSCGWTIASRRLLQELILRLSTDDLTDAR